MNILLGITGGIASYKSAILASLLVKNSFIVKTIMTDNAKRFITPVTLKTITSNYVYSDQFDATVIEDHTSLSEWGDILIVAPSTANTIARIANGFADNLLTSVILDFVGPIFIFPAMHENMWNNPATVENCKTLRKNGFYLYDPDSGDLAGGKKGKGRMIEPESILEKVITTLKKNHDKITKI